MAPSKGTPGAMSSRLAGMKFMQRAAASSGTPPSTPAEPAAKKQRLSNGPVRATPTQTPPSGGLKVSHTGDEQREEAFSREAAARGDSKWYLSVQQLQSPAAPSPLRIVSAGYGALDSSANGNDRSSDEDTVARPQVAGRMSFGKFNKAIEKQQRDDESSDSEGSSGSEASEDEDDLSDDPTGVTALIAMERKQAGDKAHAERKAKKAADKAEAARMAESRRKREVNLNNVTSISGCGGGGTRTPSGAESRACFKCGGVGHLKTDCPQASDGKRKRGVP